MPITVLFDPSTSYQFSNEQDIVRTVIKTSGTNFINGWGVTLNGTGQAPGPVSIYQRSFTATNTVTGTAGAGSNYEADGLYSNINVNNIPAAAAAGFAYGVYNAVTFTGCSSNCGSQLAKHQLILNNMASFGTLYGVNLSMQTTTQPTTFQNVIGIRVAFAPFAGSSATGSCSLMTLNGPATFSAPVGCWGLNIGDIVNSGGSAYAIQTGKGFVSFGDQLIVAGGFNLARTTVFDSSIVAVPADSCIALTGITAARTVTLPAANSVPSGHILRFVDESGQVSAVNTWTINRAGADTINGAAAAVLNAAYAYLTLECNGSNKWTIIT